MSKSIPLTEAYKEIVNLKKIIKTLKNQIKEFKKCNNCSNTKDGHHLCYEMAFPLTDLS
jgi:recombinational DNA repair protein RecR